MSLKVRDCQPNINQCHRAGLALPWERSRLLKNYHIIFTDDKNSSVIYCGFFEKS